MPRTEEIRAAAVPLLRSLFEHAIGSRPRRYQPAPEVLDALHALADQAEIRQSSGSGAWRVAEGRRWLLNRRLDGRSVPLVQRERVAIVVRNWAEARRLAALLNWFDAPAPPRSGPVTPAFLAARLR